MSWWGSHEVKQFSNLLCVWLTILCVKSCVWKSCVWKNCVWKVVGRTAADGLEWTGVRNRKTRTPRKDVGNESKLCFSNLLLLMVAPPGQNQRVAHSHQLPRVSRPSEQNVGGKGLTCGSKKGSLAARSHLRLVRTTLWLGKALTCSSGCLLTSRVVGWALVRGRCATLWVFSCGAHELRASLWDLLLHLRASMMPRIATLSDLLLALGWVRRGRLRAMAFFGSCTRTVNQLQTLPSILHRTWQRLVQTLEQLGLIIARLAICHCFSLVLSFQHDHKLPGLIKQKGANYKRAQHILELQARHRPCGCRWQMCTSLDLVLGQGQSLKHRKGEFPQVILGGNYHGPRQELMPFLPKRPGM